MMARSADGYDHTFAVPVPVELESRLGKLAEAPVRSESWLAADALARYLEHEEWQMQEIRKVLADAAAGRVVPPEDVEVWLDPGQIGLLQGQPPNLYTLGGGDPPAHPEGLRYFGWPSASWIG